MGSSSKRRLMRNNVPETAVVLIVVTLAVRNGRWWGTGRVTIHWRLEDNALCCQNISRGIYIYNNNNKNERASDRGNE